MRILPLRVLGLLVLAISLSGCASNGASQSTGAYFDDAIITAKVKTALFGDETVEGLDISVETYGGVVQLAGFVDSNEDIRKAVEITRSVDGVKSVRNDLRLKKEHE